MHCSFVLAVAALACSAVAVPMGSFHNSTIPTSASRSTSKPVHISTGVTRSSTSHTTRPHHNATSTTASSTHSSGHHSKPISTTTFTTTDYIITTKFVPVSTPVATSHGTTFYSTFLSTKVSTRTSCYPVTSTIDQSHTVTKTHVPAHPNTVIVPPSSNAACATETVTVYPQGGYYQPGQCHTCQTITYTNVRGSTITMAVPTNPWHSETKTVTETTSLPASPTSRVKTTTTVANSTTTHKPHSSGSWTKSTTKPAGTGNLTGHTRSTSTSSSSSSSSIHGTGKVPTKPYPTGNWA